MEIFSGVTTIFGGEEGHAQGNALPEADNYSLKAG
jgi:hypothetical protein